MAVFVALQVRMSLSIDENEDVLQYWINDEERRRRVVTSRPNGPRCVARRKRCELDGRAEARAPWFGDLGTIGNVSWVKKACKLD